LSLGLAEGFAKWKKGGFEKLAVKVHKTTEALMKEAQKDCKLAIAKLRK